MPAHQGRTALYRLYDSSDTVIYIGITGNPAQRFKAHWLKPWWSEVAMREIEWHETRAVAEEIEARVIEADRPRHNAQQGVQRAPQSAKTGSRYEWTPSPRMEQLLQSYAAAEAQLAQARELLEAEAVKEMTAGVSGKKLATRLPWSAPVLQKLARLNNVPRMKPPTVVSIRL